MRNITLAIGILVVGVAGLLAGCTPTEVEEPLGISTGFETYRLRAAGNVELTHVGVQVENTRSYPIYLFRECGYGDGPSREITRARGDTAAHILGLVGLCSGGEFRPPITLNGGEVYHDTIELEAGALQPSRLKTGFFQVTYHIQRTDAWDGSWSPQDPLPSDQTTSNVFEVKPAVR